MLVVDKELCEAELRSLMTEYQLEGYNDKANAFYEAIHTLNKLETHEHSTNKGYWHDIYLLTPWVATGICSCCDKKSYINPDFPHAQFCPVCGASMSDWEGAKNDKSRYCKSTEY